MSHKPVPAELRFWPKVDMSGGEYACWPWRGAIDWDGYGKFYPTRRNGVPAHRFAYELVNGKIPAGMLACHICDNPGCCNPKHVYPGTHSQNNKDAFRRGRRSLKGDLSPSRKLTSKQVLTIRRKYSSGEYTQSKLADQYGVDHTTISCIIRRKSWSHI